MIPPIAQAAKYFPLYSSILGFGSAFSSFDIVPGLRAIDPSSIKSLSGALIAILTTVMGSICTTTTRQRTKKSIDRHKNGEEGDHERERKRRRKKFGSPF